MSQKIIDKTCKGYPAECVGCDGCNCDECNSNPCSCTEELIDGEYNFLD